MKYTHLGRTGLSVSRLCLGTMNFGPQTGEADSFAIMDHALELGINFFDTANVYGWKLGEGITEQIIGRWLAQGGGRRDRIVLATKVYNAMGERPDEPTAWAWSPGARWGAGCWAARCRRPARGGDPIRTGRRRSSSAALSWKRTRGSVMSWTRRRPMWRWPGCSTIP